VVTVLTMVVDSDASDRSAMLPTNMTERCRAWCRDWPTMDCCFVVIGHQDIPQFVAAKNWSPCLPNEIRLRQRLPDCLTSNIMFKTGKTSNC